MKPKVNITIFFRNDGRNFVLGIRLGGIGPGSFVYYSRGISLLSYQHRLLISNSFALKAPRPYWDRPRIRRIFGNRAARKVLEETGLVVQDIRFLVVVDSIMHTEGTHYAVVLLGG